MKSPTDASVAYREWRGRIEPVRRASEAADHVIFSNLEPLSVATNPHPGLAIRFVARGREDYRIGARGFHLEGAKILVASEAEGTEVEIRNSDRQGTLGLCVILSERDDLEWPCGPMLLGSSSNMVGRIMEGYARALAKPDRKSDDIAKGVVRDLTCALLGLLGQVARQAASVDAVKPSTRYEMVRRAHLAEAYLRSETSRPVKLAELARIAGTSEFHLLRSFQACFGETPAQFHRRLRLTQAREAAESGRICLGAAAQWFGFADASSFSHAYRREFGHAPKWSKRKPG